MTFIELGALIALLALFAATVSPAFVRLAENQRAYRFRTEALALCSQARERALETGADVSVSFQDGEGPMIAELAWDGEDTVVARVEVPESVVPENAGSWTAVFRADGTAEAEPLEVTDGASVRYLVVLGDGRVGWYDEPPEEQEARWRAGDYEQRT
ncbi:MAG: GspH/FimT family pseudopilin [Fimbriimonadales bacterium]